MVFFDRARGLGIDCLCLLPHGAGEMLDATLDHRPPGVAAAIDVEVQRGHDGVAVRVGQFA
jgi:hypothetical protein